MRCKECGFRVRSKAHKSGLHHITKTRRIGLLPIAKQSEKPLTRVENLDRKYYRVNF